MPDPKQPWPEISRRLVYDSDWVRLHHLDLQLPDGQVARNWHLIDYPRQAAGIVPLGDDGRILMIEQYRFTTGRISWETPGGRIEAGESGPDAARRELREETGYSARNIEQIGAYHPACGSSNQVFNVFLATGLKMEGEITDTNEVIRRQWFSISQVREMIANNQIIEGMTLTALLWIFFKMKI